MNLLLPFLAAAAPFVVWPVEFLLPYPFVIEELAKLFIVYLLPKTTPFKHGIVVIVVSALLFTTTENILYLFNIHSQNDFLLRFFLTAALHTVTFLVIYTFSRKTTVVAACGVIVAMTLHFIYNQAVITLLR